MLGFRLVHLWYCFARLDKLSLLCFLCKHLLLLSPSLSPFFNELTLFVWLTISAMRWSFCNRAIQILMRASGHSWNAAFAAQVKAVHPSCSHKQWRKQGTFLLRTGHEETKAENGKKWKPEMKKQRRAEYTEKAGRRRGLHCFSDWGSSHWTSYLAKLEGKPRQGHAKLPESARYRRSGHSSQVDRSSKRKGEKYENTKTLRSMTRLSDLIECLCSESSVFHHLETYVAPTVWGSKHESRVPTLAAIIEVLWTWMTELMHSCFVVAVAACVVQAGTGKPVNKKKEIAGDGRKQADTCPLDTFQRQELKPA